MPIISVIEIPEDTRIDPGTGLEIKFGGQYNVKDDKGPHAVPKDGSGELFREVQKWIADGNTPTPFVAPIPTWKEERLAGYKDALKGAGIDSIEEVMILMFDAQASGDMTLINALKPLKDAVDVKHPKPAK